MTEAELQALEGERRRAVEQERADIVQEAQDAAAKAQRDREARR